MTARSTRARSMIAVGMLFALLAAADLPALSQSSEADPGASVTVHVANFRNLKGSLGCRLHRSSIGFPEQTEGAVEMRVPLSRADAECVFPNVSPGVYAVSVMHDENDNGRLDKNLFGVPTEGYGVSNNHTRALRPPEWDEAKFEVVSSARLVLEVRLRY